MSTRTELVEQSLLAVVTGDIAALGLLDTPDFVWHLPGKSPIPGDVHGADAWSAKLRSLLDAGLRPESLTMLVGDDYVAVLQRNVVENGAPARRPRRQPVHLARGPTRPARHLLQRPVPRRCLLDERTTRAPPGPRRSPIRR